VSVLEQIVDHKRGEVAARCRGLPLTEVRAAAAAAPPARDLLDALRAPGLSVIAEIKRRSPARGDLRVDLGAVDIARRYADGGASALSVLTDERFFNGSDDDLRAVRDAVELPILRKDFTIDAYQLYEARALGADAVLLIVRALEQSTLVGLRELAGELGLAALVEVHDNTELERAVAAGAELVGVNNRNLDTLTVDVGTSLRLRSAVPAGCTTVAESGISQPETAARLAAAGYDAILVGEALVTATDPGALLGALRRAGVRHEAAR
jgi:indole-3-glycerol phosphate synthase